MNGHSWKVCYVSPDSEKLVDRTANKRVATTDPNTFCIYLADTLSGDFLKTVLIHELGHVTMISYGLLPAIHNFVRLEHWIEAEEWICNFIADYGDEVFDIANHILFPSFQESPRHSA